MIKICPDQISFHDKNSRVLHENAICYISTAAVLNFLHFSVSMFQNQTQHQCIEAVETVTKRSRFYYKWKYQAYLWSQNTRGSNFKSKKICINVNFLQSITQVWFVLNFVLSTKSFDGVRFGLYEKKKAREETSVSVLNNTSIGHKMMWKVNKQLPVSTHRNTELLFSVILKTASYIVMLRLIRIKRFHTRRKNPRKNHVQYVKI